MPIPSNSRNKIQFSHPLGEFWPWTKASLEPLFVWLRDLSTEFRMKENFKLKMKSQDQITKIFTIRMGEKNCLMKPGKRIMKYGPGMPRDQRRQKPSKMCPLKGRVASEKKIVMPHEELLRFWHLSKELKTWNIQLSLRI